MGFGDLRGILQYVPQFRDRLFIINLEGAVVGSDNFSTLFSIWRFCILWAFVLLLCMGIEGVDYPLDGKVEKVDKDCLCAFLERGVGACSHVDRV